MQIEIKSRNGIAITDELRAYAAKRFEKVDKVSAKRRARRTAHTLSAKQMGMQQPGMSA